MDYNYVRMRNAQKNGDMDNARCYRLLYESGMKTTNNHTVSALDCINLILIIISLLLGIYILYSDTKMAEQNENKSEPVATENVGVTFFDSDEHTCMDCEVYAL